MSRIDDAVFGSRWLPPPTNGESLRSGVSHPINHARLDHSARFQCHPGHWPLARLRSATPTRCASSSWSAAEILALKLSPSHMEHSAFWNHAQSVHVPLCQWPW